MTSNLHFTGHRFKSWPGATTHLASDKPLTPVTKLYNLILARGRLRSVAGKGTVGLASH